MRTKPWTRDEVDTLGTVLEKNNYGDGAGSPDGTRGNWMRGALSDFGLDTATSSDRSTNVAGVLRTALEVDRNVSAPQLALHATSFPVEDRYVGVMTAAERFYNLAKPMVGHLESIGQGVEGLTFSRTQLPTDGEMGRINSRLRDNRKKLSEEALIEIQVAMMASGVTPDGFIADGSWGPFSDGAWDNTCDMVSHNRQYVQAMSTDAPSDGLADPSTSTDEQLKKPI